MFNCNVAMDIGFTSSAYFASTALKSNPLLLSPAWLFFRESLTVSLIVLLLNPAAFHSVAHLDAHHQYGSRTYSRCHVHGLGHLLGVGPRFETFGCEGVYAIRALSGMRDSQPYQGLFTYR